MLELSHLSELRTVHRKVSSVVWSNKEVGSVGGMSIKLLFLEDGFCTHCNLCHARRGCGWFAGDAPGSPSSLWAHSDQKWARRLARAGTADISEVRSGASLFM